MMVFEHSVPVLLIWLGLLVALGVGAFSVWRYGARNLGMWAICGMYAAFLLLLVWCLLMPGRRTVETHTLKPRFVVALDTSKSMLMTPSPDVSNRWQRAHEALAMPWAESIAAECEIDVYAFNTQLTRKMPLEEAKALPADGEGTLLRDALQKLVARYTGMNVAGGLVLSDGIDTREAFDDWAGEARPFPLYTLKLEPDAVWEQEADLRVDGAQTPKRVTVNWKTELKAVVSGQGTKGETVGVRLFKNGAFVQEVPTQIPTDGGSREVTFELDHPEVGIFSYRVYVPPLQGETNTNDNEYVTSVQVIDAKNRLLYVEGPPRYEFKYLKHALQANQQVTPLIFCQGPGGKPLSFGNAGSMTADITDQQLSYFKIVVLGDLDAEELGARRATSLVKYVEAGGSLVLLGGTDAWGPKGFVTTPLKDLLPMKSFTAKALNGEFPVVLTDTGRSHPAFAGDSSLWSVIPPILSVFPNVVPSPAARSLVVAQTDQGTQPFIVTQPYGQGKVVAIFTDTLWKWRLHPDANDNRPYQRFWDQLITWMLPEKDEIEKDQLSVFTDRETLVLGDEIRISARMGGDENAPPPSDLEVRCEIELPDGKKAPFTMRSEPVTTAAGKTYPGYVTSFKATVPGAHTVTATTLLRGRRITSDPLSFFVKPFSAESVPRAMNANVLAGIARGSGGKYFEDMQTMDRTLSGLTFAQFEEQSSEFHSLWQTWPVLAVLMLLAAGAWLLRKLNNMP